MSGILDGIDSPADLKKLSFEQLKTLAEEIRSFIIDTVSRTGGHLGSSLGVVELTVALHYVFDFACDKLLWDVGHQCYAHKIITGRRELFSRLRQADGLSGFPNPEESVYDRFAVGHAGTSVATAVGMALGAGRAKTGEKIVAIVGDASIVNGTNFEALNNLGLVNRQLLIVLNDNSMAIDATVGTVAKYFSKARLSQTYEDLRKTTKNILEHMPVIGRGMEEILERIKKTIRMTLPASQLFESLKIPYFGPVDGHDIESLIQLFDALAGLDRPAILHIYTKKGKGFIPAEKDRSRLHSTGPFELNGEAAEPPAESMGRSFTDVFGQHLVELAQKNEKIVAITSAMCDGTGLGRFRSRFADRFFDFGIAETAAVDIAAGLARTGLRPVVCIYSTFLQRAFDQIFQEVSLQNLPVVFCIDRAGFVGADGPTHHGLMDIGFLRMLPNVVLIAPAGEAELKAALEFAIEADRCVCLRYPKAKVEDGEYDLSAAGQAFEMGKSLMLRKAEGSQVTIVGYGAVVVEALKAADILSARSIAADVIDARFAAPVDDSIVELAASGRAVVTVEEHDVACGFGSAVLERLCLRAGSIDRLRFKALGAGPEFVKPAGRADQLIRAGINADRIVEAAGQLLGM